MPELRPGDHRETRGSRSASSDADYSRDKRVEELESALAERDKRIEELESEARCHERYVMHIRTQCGLTHPDQSIIETVRRLRESVAELEGILRDMIGALEPFVVEEGPILVRARRAVGATRA